MKKVKPWVRWFIVLALIFRLGIPIRAQTQSNDKRTLQGQESYRNLVFYKPFMMPTTKADSVHLHIFMKVAYDFLQFITTNGEYVAKYEWTVVIRDNAGETTDGKIRRGTITTSEFSLTNSKSDFATDKMMLSMSPGEFSLFLELMDMETKQPVQFKKKLTVQNHFLHSLSATDLLFFHSDASFDLSGNLIPEFPPVHSLTDSLFWAGFVLVSDKVPKQVNVKYKILNSNQENIHEASREIELTANILPVQIPIDLPLSFGRYRLLLEMTDNQKTLASEESFYIRWGTHPTSMPNLSLALETLKFVMDPEELDNLIHLPESEQKARLDAFWKERDPDPATPENELEEEYYRRVAFTIKNFSLWQSGIDGWKTDRGRIYILYGPPTDVERPVTSSSGGQSKYEIWHYRHLQRRFVFLDRYGTEEYRLIEER